MKNYLNNNIGTPSLERDALRQHSDNGRYTSPRNIEIRNEKITKGIYAVLKGSETTKFKYPLASVEKIAKIVYEYNNGEKAEEPFTISNGYGISFYTDGKELFIKCEEPSETETEEIIIETIARNYVSTFMYKINGEDIITDENGDITINENEDVEIIKSIHNPERVNKLQRYLKACYNALVNYSKEQKESATVENQKIMKLGNPVMSKTTQK